MQLQEEARNPLGKIHRFLAQESVLDNTALNWCKFEMPQGFIVVELNHRGGCTKVAPKRMTGYLWRAKMLKEIVPLMMLFVMGRQSCCFLGSGERLGWCEGRSLGVNNGHSHCHIPNTSKTGML